jgi:hypothetical protein
MSKKLLKILEWPANLASRPAPRNMQYEIQIPNGNSVNESKSEKAGTYPASNTTANGLNRGKNL